jgi:hypothetical protein
MLYAKPHTVQRRMSLTPWHARQKGPTSMPWTARSKLVDRSFSNSTVGRMTEARAARTRMFEKLRSTSFDRAVHGIDVGPFCRACHGVKDIRRCTVCGFAYSIVFARKLPCSVFCRFRSVFLSQASFFCLCMFGNVNDMLTPEITLLFSILWF